MDVIATITAAIALVSQIAEATSKIKDSESRMVIAQLKATIADLTEKLADIKMELLALREKNRALTSPPELVYRDNAYYNANGEGPFCPACFDRDGRAMRMSEAPTPLRFVMSWRCNVCKSHIK